MQNFRACFAFTASMDDIIILIEGYELNSLLIDD